MSVPNPSKQFTRHKQPPGVGKRFDLQSPILAAYQASKTTTMGVVTEVIETDENQLNRCVVFFRGKSLRATCCHPGITVGLNVCMIEQPIGIWWATTLQKSWYSRPLAELIEKGHKYQAALEYLMSFGPKWRPELIIIDKRGVEIPPPPPPADPWPPEDAAFPWDILAQPTDPETGNPYTFDDLDRNNDGFLSESEWPFDPYLFLSADTNKDGKISPEEWAALMDKFENSLYITSGSDYVIDNPTSALDPSDTELIAERISEYEAYVSIENAKFRFVVYRTSLFPNIPTGWFPVQLQVKTFLFSPTSYFVQVYFKFTIP